jgi:hypothetical protein
MSMPTLDLTAGRQFLPGAGYAIASRYGGMTLVARSAYDTTFDWDVIGARVRQLASEHRIR